MTQQAMTAARPLPEISPISAPFWEAARRHELVMQHCGNCARFRFPPELACFWCGSRASSWAPVSGRATLYSWTVTYPPLLPFFAGRAPWPVAIVQLEEGPRLVTNIVGVAAEDYAFEMPLRAAFEDLGDGITLVVFERAG